jgi:hypothetical protein
MSFEIVMVRSGKDPPSPRQIFLGRGNFLCGQGMDIFWNKVSIQPADGYLVSCRLYNDYSYI